ncbi:MAG: DnaJ domain-containing protein [Deltaproteobacteria bacterium]|nr:DnaJ domain-containing protein [Deltaproteobacteria bacterium]
MPVDDNQIKLIQRYFNGINKGDYYQLLRLPLGAEPAQVKEAFRRESKNWHPDRYFRQVPDDIYRMVTQVYKRMVEAHQVLTDPAVKPVYDKRIQGPDRMKYLRYSYEEEQAKQRAVKDEDICKNPNAKRYAKLAFTALSQKNLTSAELNFKLALTMETDNRDLKYKYLEVRKAQNAKLSDDDTAFMVEYEQAAAAE